MPDRGRRSSRWGICSPMQGRRSSGVYVLSSRSKRAHTWAHTAHVTTTRTYAVSDTDNIEGCPVQPATRIIIQKMYTCTGSNGRRSGAASVPCTRAPFSISATDRETILSFLSFRWTLVVRRRLPGSRSLQRNSEANFRRVRP